MGSRGGNEEETETEQWKMREKRRKKEKVEQVLVKSKVVISTGKEIADTDSSRGHNGMGKMKRVSVIHIILYIILFILLILNYYQIHYYYSLSTRF